MKNAQTSRVKVGIGAAIATLALTGLTGTAVAGAPVAKSKVTIAEKQFNFKGKVTSGKHICEARRQVSVYRINNGNEVLVGSDKTDNNGSYKFGVNIVNGGDKHFARAELKQTEKATCKEAESEKIFP